jgi:reductive dehalogenase
MGTWFNGLGIAPAFGILAGLGELSRLNRMISPEYGPLQRIFRIVTDLPLVPTKPIDAGIMRFCRTCKRCAEACPVSCLSKNTDPAWEVQGPWNSPGHRAYFENSPRCRSFWSISTVGCAKCFAVCPYSRKDLSVMHRLVAATVAKTPLFNGFFTKMHQVLGYEDQRDIEGWWDLDIPPYGNRPSDLPG